MKSGDTMRSRRRSLSPASSKPSTSKDSTTASTSLKRQSRIVPYAVFISLVALLLVTLTGIDYYSSSSASSSSSSASGSGPTPPFDIGFEGNPDLVTKIHHREKFPSNTEWLNNQLSSSGRYILHLHVDKEVYRPGDVVHVRGVALNAFSNQPLVLKSGDYFGGISLNSGATKKAVGRLEVPWYGYHADSSSSPSLTAVSHSFTLDPHQAGGDYEVVVGGRQWDNKVSTTPASRKFQVRSSSKTNPKLSMDLRFERNGYSVGDQVVVHLENVKRLSTGANAFKASVSVVARVGWKTVYSDESSYFVNKDGSCVVSFTLPDRDLGSGDGTVTLVVSDGANVQSISKTLPLVDANLDIHVFPESGDLVDQVESRVYLEARSPKTGDPADIEGEILEDGKSVATVRTTHEGRGVSSPFTPVVHKTYELKITLPKLTNAIHNLPAVQAKGALLMLGKTSHPAVYQHGQPIQLRVKSNGSVRPTKVNLFKRNILLATATVENNKARLHPPANSTGDGVLRLTLVNDMNVPLSERLVFRHPKRLLKVDIIPVSGIDSVGISSPGQKVELHVETQHEAYVAIRVTDQSRTKLIEPRRRSPTLLTSAYLEPEVSDLKDPTSYLGDSMKMDLLLNTQGWRTFVFNNVTKFLQDRKHSNDLNKFLRLVGLGVIEQPDRNILRRGVPHGGVQKMAMFAAVQNDMPVGMAAEDEGIILDDVADDAADANEQDEKAEEDMVVERVQFMPRMKRLPPKPYERVYAYTHQSHKSKVRTDFQETLFFDPQNTTKVDDEGKFVHKFSFDLSDSVTTFGVLVDGFDKNGMLGSAHFDIVSNMPVEVDVKLPVEAYVGDSLFVPLSLSVPSDDIPGADMKFGILGESLAFAPKMTSSKSIQLADQTDPQNLHSVTVKFDKKQRGIRFYIPVEAKGEGNPQFVVSATPRKSFASLRGQSLSSDSVVRGSVVKLQGFPISEGTGGVMHKMEKVRWSFELPLDTIENSVRVLLKAFPGPSGQLVQACKSLIRTPCGCFEQTSSTTYPLVLALRYLVSLRSSDPIVLKHIENAREMLRKGYEKLVSYESASGGFEWFGRDPGHEALTAYGLVQFSEMSRPELGLYGLVDAKMIERTQKWLFGRRDGKTGGFLRNEKSLDSFGVAPVHTTNAYILWSLVRSKMVSLQDWKLEIDSLKDASQKNAEDPYTTALAALVLGLDSSEEKLHEALIQRLVRMRNTTSGCIRDTEAESFSTITRSRGTSKVVEATSLAVLAWLGEEGSSSSDELLGYAQMAIKCINENARNGFYGSTQATALALQAVVEYNLRLGQKTPSGKWHLKMLNSDGGVIEEATTEFSESNLDMINVTFPVSKELYGSKLTLELGLDTDEKSDEKKFGLPFIADVDYLAITPRNDPNCSVTLKTVIHQKTVTEENVVTMDVVISNVHNETVPMTIAQVGIPSGTEVRMDKLRELTETNQIAYYEIFGTFVVLYWMQLEPFQTVTIPIDLVATIPGAFTAPASSAYLYYESEKKSWFPGSKLKIIPKYQDNVLQ